MYGMPDGFAEALARKYAILQQQADATTSNAATASTVGNANAALDITRNRLLPGQSAADIAKTTAETGLIGQQAKYLGPESMARIAQLRADANNTNTTAAVTRLEALTPNPIDSASLQAIRALRGDGGQASAFARLNPTYNLGLQFRNVLGR